MRALLLLIPGLAAADLRVEGHVTGGMEGGTVQGTAMPSRVAEYGAGVTWFAKQNGVGIVLERVARTEADLPIDSEHKLDAFVALRAKDRFVFGIGAGVRRIAVDGDPDRKGSTMWGADLLRFRWSARLVRLGPVNLDAVLSWTFGMYKGEVYGTRRGDMAYPVRDYWSVSSSYVVGLGTSFDTQP